MGPGWGVEYFFMSMIAWYPTALKRAQTHCTNHSLLVLKEGFTLLKRVSNRHTVHAAIPKQERTTEVKDLDLDNDTLPLERAVAIQWCAQSDSFKLKIMLRDMLMMAWCGVSIRGDIFS